MWFSLKTPKGSSDSLPTDNLTGLTHLEFFRCPCVIPSSLLTLPSSSLKDFKEDLKRSQMENQTSRRLIKRLVHTEYMHLCTPKGGIVYTWKSCSEIYFFSKS